MKTKFVAILICSVFMRSGTAAFAQSGGAFAITASVAAGGGGTSTGAVFSVTGTIGQAAAGGPINGGSFSMASGVWSQIALIQTPGAPLLRIARTGSNGVVISWPAPSTGWILQETTTLSSQPKLTIWTDVTSPPVVLSGSEKTVTFSPAAGLRYFRLRRDQ